MTVNSTASDRLVVWLDVFCGSRNQNCSCVSGPAAGAFEGLAAIQALRSMAHMPSHAPPVPTPAMTGVAFVLYTFYMVTDPATTPSGTKGQIAFGAAVAACYGLLLLSHVVFGLFFALSIVCAMRGIGLWTYAAAAALARAESPVGAPPAVKGGLARGA